MKNEVSRKGKIARLRVETPATIVPSCDLISHHAIVRRTLPALSGHIETRTHTIRVDLWPSNKFATVSRCLHNKFDLIATNRQRLHSFFLVSNLRLNHHQPRRRRDISISISSRTRLLQPQRPCSSVNVIACRIRRRRNLHETRAIESGSGVARVQGTDDGSCEKQ